MGGVRGQQSDKDGGPMTRPMAGWEAGEPPLVLVLARASSSHRSWVLESLTGS